MSAYLNDLGQPIGAPLDVKLPRPTPVPTALGGRLCAVVPLDIEAHCAGLYAAFRADTEGRNWTYLPYGPFDSEDDFRAWLVANCAGSDPLFHAILDKAGSAVGMVSYLRIDPANGAIEVGHINFSSRLQRTALASEAMFLMMRHAFDYLGYRRYEWKCDALNAASRRAAERLGFQYEGTFRKAAHYKGRNRDTAWFALVDDDWPRVRAEFQRWLEPGNFDDSGKQLTALSQQAPVA